ncbi:MAG: hypothetical protein U0169_26620 [Polyangiaceae bacterium]
MLREFFPALVVVTLSVAACSSGEEAPKFPTVTAFASGMAEAECETVATKCGIDLAACKSKRATYWQNAATSRTGRTYTPAQAERCVDAWRLANADGELSAAELSVTATTSASYLCERVFEGATAEKQACSKDFDCQGDLVCDEVGARAANSQFLCAKRAEKAAGDYCSNPGDVCAAGSYCALSGGVATCVAKKGDGQSCSDFEPCSETLRCTAGLCRARNAAGQECATDGDCRTDAPICADNGGTKTCLAVIAFGTGAAVCAPYK